MVKKLKFSKLEIWERIEFHEFWKNHRKIKQDLGWENKSESQFATKMLHPGAGELTGWRTSRITEIL